MFESSTSYKNSFLNISSSNTLNNIKDMLEYIKPMKLESNRKCNINSILLLNILNWNIGFVSWKTDYGIIQVEDVLREIEKTHNLDIIFWYQTNIFNTIIKYLISITLKLYVAQFEFSSNLVKSMKEIYTKLCYLGNLPYNFLKCCNLFLYIWKKKKLWLNI